MSYPKPLAKKSIDKMLSKYTTEKAEMLYQYYEAFANLYGAVFLISAWQILKTYNTGITKTEFMEFSSIVRREEHDYRVYEQNEVYSEEEQETEYRIIAHRKLILDGYGSFTRVYSILESQMNYPPFIPEDLRYYSKIRMPKEWNELKTTIGNIKAEEKLSKTYVLNRHDISDLDYYKSEKKKEKIQARAEIPVSERIADALFMGIMLGNTSSVSILSHQFDLYNAIPTENQLNRIINLLMEASNNAHMWHNFGWTPTDIRKKMGNKSPKSVSFGPGIQKSFADGTLDEDEVKKKLLEMGIDIVE